MSAAHWEGSAAYTRLKRVTASIRRAEELIAEGRRSQAEDIETLRGAGVPWDAIAEALGLGHTNHPTQQAQTFAKRLKMRVAKTKRSGDGPERA